MKKRINSIILFIILVSVLSAFQYCRFSHDKQKELARLDSLSRDSTQKAYNPYKAGQGTQVYDQQRESLGNLDSLVSP
jgi:hypothetical protein